MRVPTSVSHFQPPRDGKSPDPCLDGSVRPEGMTNSRLFDNQTESHMERDGTGDCRECHSGAEEKEDAMEPIAVVGMAVKFPQDASSVEGFWQMLFDGKSSVTEIPKGRINIDAYHDPDKDHFGTMNGRGGHFIKDDIAAFDAAFFSIRPKEAASLDPQQRWLLETTYQALENAGIPLERAMGSNTCVHVGSFLHDHADLLKRDPEFPGRYRTTGALQSLLANRLSWFFNFTGASITMDTACSSTIHAVHLSCQALRMRESKMGIVAGSNIFYDPQSMLSMSDQGVLSPDSTCYTFDERANGYSRGEGVGVLILKPLSVALHDGDTVRAVIRSTGLNQDGRTDGGITQPSPVSQAELIRNTYQNAALDMALTRYVEAHGTGTPLGDPAETSAIGAAFQGVKREAPLIVGAVKTNIGHLEATSGLAGIVKTVLVLERGFIPPNINFKKLNPKIKAREWDLEFPDILTPWPGSGLRRASVNSFGLGGSNGHAVLDDAYHYMKQRNLSGRHATCVEPESYALQLGGPTFNKEPASNGSSQVEQERKPLLFVWSTSDQAGANRLFDTYTCHFNALNEGRSNKQYLDRLAYTLCEKRSHLAWRSFVVARTLSELRSRLHQIPSNHTKSGPRRLAFVFTGQGAQWPAMGREMFSYKTFQSSIKAADMVLRSLNSAWSIESELLRDKDSSKVHNPALSHLLCVAVQVALVDLLMSWKVVPSAVVGHSSGEIAAAYCARALSFHSVIKLAFYRGVVALQLRDTQTEPHGMLAVGLSASSTQEYIASAFPDESSCRISVACINSPQNVTVAGPIAQIHKLKALLYTNQVFAKVLRVDVAYHSDFMRPGVEMYRELIGRLEPSPNTSPTPSIVSSVTGQVISKEDLQKPEYWAQSLVRQVKFSVAVSHLCSSEFAEVQGWQSTSASTIDCCLEVGPHSAMHSSLHEILNVARPGLPFYYQSLLQRGKSAFDTVLSAIGTLHCLGLPVDIAKINNCTEYEITQLVDLPPYPFNHSAMYWDESRMNRNTRLRQFPRHDLLGSPVPDWNPLEAKWRNYITLGENIWVAGHRVNGLDVSPAAGMLVMAVEAMYQLLDVRTRVIQYKFRDVVFRKALSAPKEGVIPAVETEFHLRRPLDGAGTPSTWAEFSLYMFDNDDWVQCCRGSISAEHEDSNEPSWVKNLDTSEDPSLRFDTCDKALDSEDLYRYLSAAGLEYGPMFQGLRNICHNGSQKATATADLEYWKHELSGRTLIPRVIHPAALDTVFQLIFPTVSDGCQVRIPTFVPTRIDALCLSTTLGQVGQPGVRVFAEAQSHSRHRVHASCVAVHPKTGKRCIEVSFQVTAVASSNLDAASQVETKPLCYHIETRPDLDLLDGKQTEFWCSLNTTPYVPDSALSLKRLYLCYIAMARLCKRFCGSEALLASPELHHYLDWARYRLAEASENSTEAALSHEVGNEEFLSLLEEVEYSGPEGKLISRVARNLERFFTGEITAVEFFLNDDAINNMYTLGLGVPNVFEQVARFIDALAHKKPDMRILEVGAGIGSATACLLEALTNHGAQESDTFRFSEYCYTDISPAFLDRGREKFANFVAAGQMIFLTLDIGKDPQQQNIKAGTYDLVVALNVIHATPSIHQSLAHCRKLLRPGGRILLIELTGLHLMPLEFIFGLFPGWWLSTEEHRQRTPLMSEEQWDSYLKSAGFSGIDATLRNHQDAKHHAYSAMISTAAICAPERTHPGSTFIVVDRKSSEQTALALQLQERCFADSHSAVVSLSDIANHNGDPANYIFLVEIDRKLLCGISSTNFRLLQKVLSSAKSVLWVMDGADTNPFTSLITGLQRTYRAENGSLPFATFSLADGHIGAATSNNIAKILGTMQDSAVSLAEAEYVERNGLVHIRRVVETDAVNQRLFQPNTEVQLALGKFGQHPQAALKLGFKSPGLLNTLHFTDDPHVQEPLQHDEIEVKIKYSGLNFRDLLTALGQLESDILGLEGSGVVTRVGEESGFAVGDVVCGLFLGSFQTFARCKAKLARRIPEPLDLQSAAALPIVFCTAYHSLVNLARLRPGESILIHSGAGGLGQAAIQIAKHLKAEIFVTVGTEENRQFLIDQYEIEDRRVFYSRSLAFVKHVKRLTGGRGVDVVLNSLSGERSRVSWECIAPFGRFIETGRRDIEASEPLPMALFADDAIFSSVNLINIVRQKPELASQLLDSVLALAASSQISVPLPLHIYPVGQLEEALRTMQSGKNSGKIVIELREDDHVPILDHLALSTQFKPDMSYVIAGGLGGLGRAITKWMLSRGARYFILLSRSIKTDADTRLFLDSLRLAGATVTTPVCDICDIDSLSNALHEATTKMPPIRGCIQAAMVLKNGQFNAMSHEDFQRVLDPKLHGSWNLHVLLPWDLDFFILCSSVAGIVPSFGQSNYAAGNTFQDALARYRTSHGEKAVSLDFGMLVDVGFVASHAGLAEQLIARDTIPLHFADLLRVIDYYCNGSLLSLSPDESHAIIGLHPAYKFRVLGLEEPHWIERPLFSHLARSKGRDTTSSSSLHNTNANIIDIATLLGTTDNIDIATEFMTDALTAKLAKMLVMDPTDIQRNKPAHAHGIDSLVAMELREWFRKVVRVDITVFEIQGNSSIVNLARNAVRRSDLFKPGSSGSSNGMNE
ncbi:hypothetical protein BDV41DRAFT_575726 [Aspergillus transmontanensis]|uniref:Carrier domain-containing protein n=1 Tax=Aspergillus transmontanensis TaxID=1034304 RepID=A0A5N6W0W3_9EURO|nr:hypothetical protein BDV41DRAFT_575726 [Aspergillus transmontanensis]